MDIGRYGILYVHNLHGDTYTVPMAYAGNVRGGGGEVSRGYLINNLNVYRMRR